MFYSLENRPDVKAKNPEFGVGKLAQCLAERWRVMDAAQKHPYETMARKDKERYEQELKAYKKGSYTGSGLTPRQVAHSVTGRTIPPPATTNHRDARRSSSLSGLNTGGSAASAATASTPTAATAAAAAAAAAAGGLGMVATETKPNILVSPSEDEGSPPSGDELDQLCEFYQ